MAPNTVVSAHQQPSVVTLAAPQVSTQQPALSVRPPGGVHGAHTAVATIRHPQTHVQVRPVSVVFVSIANSLLVVRSSVYYAVKQNDVGNYTFLDK